MSPRQLFKFGFLLRCADEGLTPAQTQLRIAACLEKVAADGSGWGHMLADAGLGLGALGLAGAGAGGAGLGYMAARMTEPQADPETAKQQELIAAYKQYADHARRLAARRTYRPSSTPNSPRLLAG